MFEVLAETGQPQLPRPWRAYCSSVFIIWLIKISLLLFNIQDDLHHLQDA
jgi:hypothetical protein